MGTRYFFIICFFLTSNAFSLTDLEYYQMNISKAEAKMMICDKAIEVALIAEDEAKLVSLLKDNKCKAAREAFKDYQWKENRIKSKLENEKRKEEREKKAIAKKKIYNKEFSEQLANFKALNNEQFELFKDPCNIFITQNKSCGTCDAYNISKKERKIEKEELFLKNIILLKKKHINGELESYKKSTCKGTNRFRNADCKMLYEAVKQQQKEKILYYLSNRNLLVKDFNKCHEKYEALEMHTIKRRSEIAKTYECFIISKVARNIGHKEAKEIGIYDFKKAIN